MHASQEPSEKFQTGTGKPPPKRTWPLTALALLLLIQALGFYTIGIYHLSQVGWREDISVRNVAIHLPIGLLGLAFFGLALLALFAAVGFFRLWSNAWVMGMLTQGLSLVMGISLYYRVRPNYLYLILVFGIFMVVFMNFIEVPADIKKRWSDEEWGGVRER